LVASKQGPRKKQPHSGAKGVEDTIAAWSSSLRAALFRIRQDEMRWTVGLPLLSQGLSVLSTVPNSSLEKGGTIATIVPNVCSSSVPDFTCFSPTGYCQAGVLVLCGPGRFCANSTTNQQPCLSRSNITFIYSAPRPPVPNVSWHVGGMDL
jgi:hypothetical protein